MCDKTLTVLLLRVCRPSLSVSSLMGMALGRSCLLANTSRTASLSSSSWSCVETEDLSSEPFVNWITNESCTFITVVLLFRLCSYPAGWERAFGFMLGVTEFWIVFARKGVRFLTIFWSSSAASCARSRSLLSTTKIRPWRNNTTQVNHASMNLYKGSRLIF